MSNFALRAQHLGKRFRIARTQAYRTLREELTDGAIGIGKTLSRILLGVSPSRRSEHIWALRDVSFEVRPGEVIGIIGRNGAGKSTLLKVLARITEPTEGEAEVVGRVASLLEVGTGFHPELSGRENVFLNGVILGMSRVEVESRFHEIVSFAEVEKFIDTPVKHYSSGMFLRLAFSVAAHLEPDILIVDEVLAVGDASFQRKCLGKMEDAARGGRTVLFVSHDLRAIQLLCGKVMLLNGGRLERVGKPSEIVQHYLKSSAVTVSEAIRNVRDENREAPSVSGLQKGVAKIVRIAITDEDAKPITAVDWATPFCFRLSVEVYRAKNDLNLAVAIKDAQGRCVFVSHSVDRGLRLKVAPGDLIEAICVVDPNVLMPGEYIVDIWVGDEDWQGYDFLRNVLSFIVSTQNLTLLPGDRRPGSIYFPLTWTIEMNGLR